MIYAFSWRVLSRYQRLSTNHLIESAINVPPVKSTRSRGAEERKREREREREREGERDAFLTRAPSKRKTLRMHLVLVLFIADYRKRLLHLRVA